MQQDITKHRHFKDDYEPIIHDTTFGITLTRQRKKHPSLTPAYY
jgi:hypothetical protein